MLLTANLATHHFWFQTGEIQEEAVKNIALFVCWWISVSTLLVTILPLRCGEKKCVQLKLQAMVNLV